MPRDPRVGPLIGALRTPLLAVGIGLAVLVLGRL